MGKRTIRRRVYTTLLYFEQMNDVFLMQENVLYTLSYEKKLTTIHCKLLN